MVFIIGVQVDEIPRVPNSVEEKEGLLYYLSWDERKDGRMVS